MTQHKIILRAANPTFEEGLDFARYLDQAAEGFFRIMLGRKAANIVATAYMQPNNDYSYQNATFVERDGVTVGMVSGYSADQHRRFMKHPLKLAPGYRTLRMVRVALCCAPFQRFLEFLAEGDFYIQAIAVDKKLRGEGIGSTLIDAIEEQARAAGATRLSLGVSTKNKGARRLYERRGMTIESVCPSLSFLPPVIARMTKSL